MKMIIIKHITLPLFFSLTCAGSLYSQDNIADSHHKKAIEFLIDQYSKAREQKDTALLKTILTADVDHLVSTGEWRNGMAAAVDGMLASSATSPGTRTLRIEKIRMLGSNNAIVDCKYEIQNKDGTIRQMWSTFIVVADKAIWKISAIRNMLPARN